MSATVIPPLAAAAGPAAPDPGPPLPRRYTADPYRYRRRPTRTVAVGDVGIGGANPIRVQSMTTTDTMDTDATVAQTERLVRAGCEIVRITAPTVEDARNLGAIRRVLRQKGIRVPLVADIHFNPAAAMEAADHVEKVRINPGNFADSKRFAVREYSDAQYAAELERIEERFGPLVDKCKARGIAMRIGTNHGSLSDRIMNRFGDTPLGMVESALEFAGICASRGYHDVVFSMKASNPKVMIQAYRLLAARLDALGPAWAYPFHLGVTEAGNGEDGRIKSAIGIGSLLADGIGDTVRVSLTEDPEAEVPVAFALVRPYQPRPGAPAAPAAPAGADEAPAPAGALPDARDPYQYRRRAARPVPLGTVTLGAVAAAAGGEGPPAGWPVRVVHPFPGPLSRVPQAAAQALELNAADGLIRARPDALSVLVRSDEDAVALRRLRAALDAAPTAETGPDLPLVVCAPADFPGLGAVVEDAGAVCLNVGDGPSPALAAALATVARARRPLVLEVTPAPAPAPAGDPALPAGRAVDRLLAGAAEATAAGNRDLVLSVTARDPALALRTYRLLSSRLAEAGLDYPLHLVAWPDGDAQDVLLRAAVLLGSLLCDGIGDSVQIMGATRGGPGRALDDAARARLAFNILQGAGVRLTKTEFVACPSCGRTLFDLQETTERIQRQTGHLKGVKIAVMGCIVNGPGEMADADFGYVGGAPDKVNLYVGKECVEKGVPAAVADARLIDLIRRHGKWVDVP